MYYEGYMTADEINLHKTSDIALETLRDKVKGKIIKDNNNPLNYTFQATVLAGGIKMTAESA